jgi:hypothetical protein
MIAEASTDILVAQSTIMGWLETIVISFGSTAGLLIYWLGRARLLRCLSA